MARVAVAMAVSVCLLNAVTNPVPFIAVTSPVSVTPAGADFTLTVMGTGLVNGASAIYWNGSPLPDPTACEAANPGGTPPTFLPSCTVTVRAAKIAAPGTASITVVNPETSPLDGTSNVAFLPIAAATANVAFSSRTYFATQAVPNYLAVGDFNGDGNLDLAVSNRGDNNVTILLGDGHGGLTATSPAPTVGKSPQGVVVGDFNGDGKLDLAVVNYGSDTVSILLGDGTGNFSLVSSPATGHLPIALAAGDFNGDGNLDLAVVNSCASGANCESTRGTVTILLGDGTGHFTANSTVAAGSFPYAVAVGDFNGDGKLDLAVANSWSDNVTILLGDGTGLFTATASSPPTGQRPESVAVGDFNGDGKLDLAVGNQEDVTVLLGDGTGKFTAATSVAFGTFAVAAGDFNGDGRLDLAALNAGGGLSALLLQAPPAMTITKTHAAPFFTQGQTGATYTITASNSGAVATSGALTVTDTLPTGLTATAMSGGGWDCSGNAFPVTGNGSATVSCTRSDALAAGISDPAITLTVDVAADALSSVTNTATVVSNTGSNTSNDVTAIHPQGFELTSSKSHVGSFTQGQTGATYYLRATNSGSVTGSGVVTMIDTLPASLTATAMSGLGWTCTLGTLSCMRSDALTAGLTYPAITLAVSVAENAPATVTNTAEVEWSAGSNTANDLTTILPGPPTADSVSPVTANGPSQTFTLKYSTHNGKASTDLSWVEVLFNSVVSGNSACDVRYHQTNNGLYLQNDVGNGWLGPLTPGVTGTLANSQCTVNLATSTVSGTGGTLTLTLTVSAAAGFVRTKNTYMWTQDSEGLNSGWQTKGTWKPAADVPPTADSVSPSAPSSPTQTFTLKYSTQNGKASTDLNWADVLFNSALSGKNACYVLYNQTNNRLYLENDAGNALLGPLTPGAGTLSNSQCTLNGAGTTVSGSGGTLTLTVSVTATAGFLGAKNTYMWTRDSEGSNSGWQNKGTWTP